MPLALVSLIYGIYAVFWQGLWPLLKQAFGWVARRRGPLLDGFPRAVEHELTDPLRFILGAVMILVNRFPDRIAFMRLGAALAVAVVALAAPVLGVVLTGLSPLAYALTVFGLGLVTLIPDRIYDLRRDHRLTTAAKGYPRPLKTGFFVVEVVGIVVAGGLLIGFAIAHAIPHHVFRGCTWGVLTVALADVTTVVACAVMGVAISVGNLVRQEREAGQEVTSVAQIGSQLAEGPLAEIPALEELSRTRVAQVAAELAVETTPLPPAAEIETAADTQADAAKTVADMQAAAAKESANIRDEAAKTAAEIQAEARQTAADVMAEAAKAAAAADAKEAADIEMAAARTAADIQIAAATKAGQIQADAAKPAADVQIDAAKTGADILAEAVGNADAVQPVEDPSPLDKSSKNPKAGSDDSGS